MHILKRNIKHLLGLPVSLILFSSLSFISQNTYAIEEPIMSYNSNDGMTVYQTDQQGSNEQIEYYNQNIQNNQYNQIEREQHQAHYNNSYTNNYNTNNFMYEDNFKGLKPKNYVNYENLPINIRLIEEITGVRNHVWYDEPKVFKIFIPRDDLGVSIAGTRINSDMGLTCWIAFKPVGNTILAIGDLVLHENQVNPVLDELLANNIKVTGLHSEFLWDNPKVMFMHIEGQGDEKSLSMALAKVFVKLRENYGKSEANQKNFFSKIRPNKIWLTQNTIDTVDRIIGKKGFTSTDKQIYKFIFGRSTKIGNESLGKAMGVRSWAAFTGSDKEASITGDLAVYETELQSVLKSLRDANIKITGIQQRMMGENPRILYVHYWGTGSIETLANGLRAALEKTGYQNESSE